MNISKPLAATVAAALAATFLSVSLQAADYETGTATAASRPWAYQPVQRPQIPAVKNAKWVRAPVDAFVLAKIEAAGLTPSKDADRATFIRRATLDTWGLLPTPEEVRAFEKDHSKEAYEKLVDRLLASPRYGERWGRRWLDLTRYADSDGYNADGVRPNIWRYRDYVIKAYNDDKPYDVFIKEQLAGDEIWPNEQDARIATGFLRNFPDEINARDLNLKKQEVANDLTDTVGSVLLGSTVGCAQCHNHKFDKISQKEYYQLQSFFVNTSWNDDVPAVGAKDVEDYNKKLVKYQAATKDIQAKMDAILQPVIDKLEEDRLSGFVPETRVSITKPEAERSAYDRWIYHRNLWTMQGRTRNAEQQLKKKDPARYLEYTDLQAELKKFDKLKPKELPQYSTVTELGADTPPTYVLFKGIYDRKLDEVRPGFPSLFTDAKPEIKPTATSSGRRTALANWITDPANPLTARVFVNRVWGQYFGHAIVETVGDFGKMGAKPTNPELLDYLADSFVHDGKWSIKALQRQILLSSTYRQSSAARAEVTEKDPGNKLLAVFPRQRLDAEEIRDSLLQAANLLDETIGGPPVMPPQPPLPNQAGLGDNFWKVSDNPRDQNRRSVYVFVKRNNPYPLLDTFDWANPQVVHAKREVTTTAPQALALINSDLVYGWSQVLAGRVIREAGDKDAARIARLFEILYGREPSKAETRELLAFLDNQEKVLAAQLAAGKPIVAPDGYGQDPKVGVQLDQLYRTLYGREADHYERVSLVSYIEKQQKADAARGADAPANKDASPQPAQATDPHAARAAAFVDLAHALANSNEFSYRF